MKTLIATVVAAVATAPVWATGLNSGLDKGESVTPFHPDHIAGPLAGTNRCFPCTFGSRPALQAWVNGDDTGNVTKLAKALQMNMDQHQDREFKAMIVVLTSDKETTRAKVLSQLKEAGVKDVAVALLDPSSPAVKAYKINTDQTVKNTVLVYKDLKVQEKFVNLKMDDRGCDELCGAIASLTK